MSQIDTSKVAQFVVTGAPVGRAVVSKTAMFVIFRPAVGHRRRQLTKIYAA